MSKYYKFIIGLVSGIVITFSVMLGIFSRSERIAVNNPSNFSFIDDLSGTIGIDDSRKAFREIWDLLGSQYYYTGLINENKMTRQAIASFVDALDDPYTTYLEPVENKDFVDSIQGNQSIEGIGALLTQKNTGIMVQEVVKGSPAAQAGVLPFDIIVRVNSGDLRGMELRDVIQKIRGPKGTTVSLTILRTDQVGKTHILQKEVTRDSIVVPTVSSQILKDQKGRLVGYIALSLFTEDADKQVSALLSGFRQEKVHGIIMDVRGNGGGLLPQAVDIASHFVAKGRPIVKAHYRIYESRTYTSVGGKEVSIPLIILVDGLSASASEILASGIKESRCAIMASGSSISGDLYSGSHTQFDKNCSVQIVGSTTFGKGSIQELQQLDFGGSLKFTVGARYTPNNYSVDKFGITPDTIVEFDVKKYTTLGVDNQINKALSILSQK